MILKKLHRRAYKSSVSTYRTEWTLCAYGC